MPLFDKLLSVIAPHSCLGCEAEGSLLCPGCQQQLLLPVPARCYRCHSLSPDFRVCGSCKHQGSLKHVWVATTYDNTAKELIRLFKFGRASAAAAPIARAMSDTLPFLGSRTVITYVPTASSRVRHRGYDHAALLATELARLQKLTTKPLLGRMGHSRQVGASRAKRQQQLANSFYPLNAKRISRAHLLLVDDIVTTGASLESAAKALRQAGAGSVSAVVFAQKQ